MKDQSKYIKLLEVFTGKKVILEDFNYEDDGPDWDNGTITDYISQRLGETPASYSGSADWGGQPVWPLGNSNYVGVFVILDDNDQVHILERKIDPATQDTYLDKVIQTANDFNELNTLLATLKK